MWHRARPLAMEMAGAGRGARGMAGGSELFETERGAGWEGRVPWNQLKNIWTYGWSAPGLVVRAGGAQVLYLPPGGF